MNSSNITEVTSDNHSADVSCDLINRRTAVIGGVIACAFIFITSLLGNTLVVIVVYRERRMRTIVNFLIVNMAVSDFLCTVSVIPRVLAQTFTYPQAWLTTETVGDALCKVVYFVQDVTVAVSLLSLLIIAIERYYATSRPIIADPTQRNRCKAMIVSTWLMACIIYATHFYTFKLIIEDEGAICVHTWEPLLKDTEKASKIEFLLHTVLFVFIPFVVVTTLYATILLRIRRTSVPEDASAMAERRRKKRNRNVLRMLLAVVIAFGSCWFPFIIYTYVVTYVWHGKHIDPPCELEFFGECTLYLTYLNSSINPTIYFVFSVNYRKGLNRLIWPCLSPFSNISTKQTSKQVDTPHTKRTPRGGVGVVQAHDIELRAISKR